MDAKNLQCESVIRLCFIYNPFKPDNYLQVNTMRPSDGGWDYSKYIKTSEKMHLPPRVESYFRTLESSIEDSKNAMNEVDSVPKMLLNAFDELSKDEKVRYVTENLKYVASISNNKRNGPYKLTKSDKEVEVRCEKRGILCFYSTYLTLKLETEPRTLMINQSKSIKMVELEKYIVRSERSMGKYKIFLEPIVEAGTSWQGVSKHQFTLSKEEFQQIYDDLYNCVMDIRNQQLAGLFSNTKQLLPSEILRPNTELPKKLINKKQYKIFSDYKHTVLSQKGISYLKFEEKIFQESNIDSRAVIRRSLKDPFLFKVQIFANESVYEIKQRFLSMLQKQKNQLLVESELLENYEESTSDCVALYEKYLLCGTPHSTIYMREIMSLTGLLMTNSFKSIMSIEEKKRFDDFIFYQSLDSPFAKSFFNYMCVFCSENSSDKKYSSELAIVAEFNLTEKFTTPKVKEFLCEFYYASFDITRKSTVQQRQKELFMVKNQPIHKPMKEAINADDPKSNQEKNSSTEDNKEVPVQFADPENGAQIARSRFISDERQTVEKLTAPYLRHRFDVEPLKGYDVSKNLVKESFMKDQWIKSKNGGLICTNQKLLSEHKKIFKHILASIGTNILKGGNILNVSLPVTIFKKQGHLQMIADSFSLSPKLLEGVRDPLERMKKAVVISVSIGTLGISVEKPFFPTLGETLQVWIGGCPMYMEQILRYPPTGAYLFYGRGYKIYGQVEPKISFGINGGKGYSERPSYIEFDDGQKIQLSYGKLVISGIFVGDRQFNFYDKTFAFDPKNKYFAQLIFGARQTQLFGKNKQTSDFLYGKIYEVSDQFCKKFEETPPPKPYPIKKHIVKILSEFQGYWNGAIKFDDKEYIDFEKDLPSVVEVEQFALPSDTRFRKDLSNLLKGNTEEAQRQKQVIEQTQRRDRKLRAEKPKKK